MHSFHEVFLQIPGAASALEYLIYTEPLPQLMQTEWGADQVSCVPSFKVIHHY